MAEAMVLNTPTTSQELTPDEMRAFYRRFVDAGVRPRYNMSVSLNSSPHPMAPVLSVASTNAVVGSQVHQETFEQRAARRAAERERRRLAPR